MTSSMLSNPIVCMIVFHENPFFVSMPEEIGGLVVHHEKLASPDSVVFYRRRCKVVL